MMGLSEPPVNDFAALEEVRVPNSCEWLISKPKFSSWCSLWTNSAPIFWLLGNAGCGKSVLCTQVINKLQKEERRCSYFFFKYGTDVDASIAGCLRALAYQIAISDEAILREILEVEQKAVPCVQWDERTTWRKLFMGCIFKLSKPLRQYWVIDALDECQGFSKLLALIKEVPPYIRIFLSSRRTPEAQQWLTTLGSLVEPYHVQSEDIVHDLGIFVDSRLGHLPVDHGNSRLKVRERLLENSSGSFLWVTLIIRELEHAYSEEDAEEILDEVPKDMYELYTRMLEGLPTTERAVRLTQCLFSWTLLTRRALTVGEMECAIKLDLKKTVHNLAKHLSAICGQFMSVDQSHRIQSIHKTAHIFLLSQDAVPELVVDEQKSHTRIAQACLNFLNGSQLLGTCLQRPESGISRHSLGNDLLDYACTSFSDHVQKGVPDDVTTFDLLCTFLETKIATWIEFLANKSNLHHAIRTARNLQVYLQRRVNAVGSRSSGEGSIESWTTDLAKVFVSSCTILALAFSNPHFDSGVMPSGFYDT